MMTLKAAKNILGNEDSNDSELIVAIDFIAESCDISIGSDTEQKVVENFFKGLFSGLGSGNAQSLTSKQIADKWYSRFESKLPSPKDRNVYELC